MNATNVSKFIANALYEERENVCAFLKYFVIISLFIIIEATQQ